MACVRVCPADAVAVQGPEVRIVDEACTRCGLCLPACPHDAIVATGDVARALELAIGGRAALILSVESAAYFYPATPEQVVNACYAAGFRTVHRGVLGDELVAREYLSLWSENDWGTMIRSTCPVIVETVRVQYPELIPYLAPVATPIAAEARYLKQLYGTETPVVYTGVCITEGGPDVDAAITFDDLAGLLERRGVTVHDQASYFSRVPEERRRHWSTAGGLPLEVLMEETHASRRFARSAGWGRWRRSRAPSPWTTSIWGSWTSCRARGAWTTRCSAPGTSCSGGARSLGRPSPPGRAGRWWTPGWRERCGWARCFRSTATATGRRRRRSMRSWGRSGSLPTASRGTAGRAATRRAAPSRTRRPWGGRRSSRAPPISTRWRSTRSFRRQWTRSPRSPPTACCATGWRARWRGVTGRGTRSPCCSWTWTTSSR